MDLRTQAALSDYLKIPSGEPREGDPFGQGVLGACPEPVEGTCPQEPNTLEGGWVGTKAFAILKWFLTASLRHAIRKSWTA